VRDGQVLARMAHLDVAQREDRQQRGSIIASISAARPGVTELQEHA